MQPAHDEKTGLVTRVEIAERLGISRPAVSNWARRHPDFPSPVRSGDTELFHESEVERWLSHRRIPRPRLLAGEPADTTYADRFRRTGRTRPATARQSAGRTVQHSDADDKRAVTELMGALADRVRGPAPMTDYVHLLLVVMYTRHAEPGRWHQVDEAMRTGQDARDVQGLLRFLGEIAQETLRRHGDRTDMRSSLLQLEPRSWDDLVTVLRKAAATGSGAFELVWDAFSAREGLQSAEFCSPAGLASLAASLVLSPGEQATVFDPYVRGGEMLAAARRRLGYSPESLYGETLDGRLQAVASLHLLHVGVRPKLTSNRSDRWPPSREHRADVVLTNPPFNMSDAPGPGVRTGDWPYGAPPRGNDNFAWVQYVLGAMTPGGRAAVVMPVKAANSVNGAESAIRRTMVTRGAVECVITLPPNLFSATEVPVALWLLRRVEHPVRDEVLFVDAQELGARLPRRRVLQEEDLDAITEVVLNWFDAPSHPETPGYASPVFTHGLSVVAVPRAKIKGDAYSLLPAHYLGGGTYGAPPSPGRLVEVGTELADRAEELRLTNPPLAKVEARYSPSGGAGGWQETTLADVCHIQAGPSYTRLRTVERSVDHGVPLVFPQDLVDGRIRSTSGKRLPWSVASGFAKFELNPGDIVCVRTGAQQQPALVTEAQAGWLLSSNVHRLRVSPEAGIDPRYLHAYLCLRHARDWMSHRAAATAAPSLSSAALGHLPVRFPPLAQQLRCVKLLGELRRRAEAHAAYGSALDLMGAELAEHLLHGLLEPA
ncbi:N-6 DNA methylase [Streptomyces koyangensis]|uniref:N-6 DNA methylase n=1 Tax=Streptomyces koyangensis TaxID=188770 RepID=UPI0013C41783|nr:N-6 DNA methylase [Streptomyces koyangensis]